MKFRYVAVPEWHVSFIVWMGIEVHRQLRLLDYPFNFIIFHFQNIVDGVCNNAWE